MSEDAIQPSDAALAFASKLITRSSSEQGLHGFFIELMTTFPPYLHHTFEEIDRHDKAEEHLAVWRRDFALIFDAYAQQREQAAYERGKAEERARILEELEAEDKANDNLMTATEFAFHIKQGFGSGLRRAIKIANQAE